MFEGCETKKNSHSAVAQYGTSQKLVPSTGLNFVLSLLKCMKLADLSKSSLGDFVWTGKLSKFVYQFSSLIYLLRCLGGNRH